ncbi:MAG: hypothetical protein LQ342_001850 [Letrouitia transgressa]|nr:MAG: hypothetical protein LQ342_001850 [Letrouitia transgressa]
MRKNHEDEPQGSWFYDDADAASVNINSKLVNPFQGLRHEEMDELINAFMTKSRIDSIYQEPIRKGAFLAQDREAFNDTRDDGLELSSEERTTTAFGIMLGYIAGVVFRSAAGGDSPFCEQNEAPHRLLSTRCSLNWRLMLASPMILPLIAVAYVYTLPESPRWLLLKARQGKTEKYEAAFRSLCRLRHSRLQAARDLFLMHHLLDGEEDIKKSRNRFIEIWSVDRNRRALVASLIVMFFQQFCGVNVLAYYSSPVFNDAGLSERNALLVRCILMD